MVIQTDSELFIYHSRISDIRNLFTRDERYHGKGFAIYFWKSFEKGLRIWLFTRCSMSRDVFISWITVLVYSDLCAPPVVFFFKCFIDLSVPNRCGYKCADNKCRTISLCLFEERWCKRLFRRSFFLHFSATCNSNILFYIQLLAFRLIKYTPIVRRLTRCGMNSYVLAAALIF